jgi:hypothetical protein
MVFLIRIRILGSVQWVTDTHLDPAPILVHSLAFMIHTKKLVFYVFFAYYIL